MVSAAYRSSRSLSLVRKPSPKSRAHEDRLLRRYHDEGDVAARQELIERFLPLARELASRYSYTDQPLDDLVQVASLGLIKAIDRFDPGRGTRFTSFATPTILGELKRYFRDKGWGLHVPRDLQERALAVTRETEALSKGLGRSPTTREVAHALGWSAESVVEAKDAGASYTLASLDAPAARDEAGSIAVLELLGNDDRAYDLVADRQALTQAWRELPDRERRAVELRFMHNLTQREIGQRMGCSQMQISRLLGRAFGRLETATAA